VDAHGCRHPGANAKTLSAAAENGSGGQKRMSVRGAAVLLSNWIVACAVWLVPFADRHEWIAEWRAELWHASACPSWKLLGSSLGAFPDAFWIRRFHPARGERRLLRAG